jgi:uncharacterized membrane protein YdjX (TVP38/TMEM64 family)
MTAPKRNNSLNGSDLDVRSVRLWKWAGPIIVSTAAVAAVIIWFENEQAFIAWKSELQPLPYFGLLMVAGTIGVPTTPLYILAGVLFGPWTALLGSAASVFGYQTLSYVIARGPLRRWTDRLRTVIDERTPRGWLHNPAARIALVRVMPGLPGALKNYAAASMGANLPLYLAISWPLGFIGASALVVLGDSFATRRPEEAVIALLMVLPIALIVYQLKRRWQRQVDTGNAEFDSERAIPSHASGPRMRVFLLAFIERHMAGGQR